MSAPERSRGLRRVALASSGGTLLALTAVLCAPGGKELAMPGELRSFHAPLREECERCHEASPEAFQGPFAGLLASRLSAAQSERCVVCHDTWEAPRAPHSWSSGEGEPVDCAACHHEHGGRDEPLAALDDAACQTCHSERFESFEDGHPEFHARAREPRLAFDHASHLASHFPRAFAERGVAAPEPSASCDGCHAPAADGEVVEVRPFAESCGPCHSDEIHGSKQVDGRGLSVLAVPALDVMSLEDDGITTGAWPADSSVGERPLPALTALLLAADADARRDLAAYRALDPLDLHEATSEERRAVERVLWRFKALCLELARGGQDALAARIERLAGTSLAPERVARLCGGLTAEALRRSVEEWFPGLEEELARRAAGEASPFVDSAALDADLEDEARREAWVLHGGWYRQRLDPALRYRPSAHGDPFLAAWLELACELEPALPEARAFLDEAFAETAVGVCAKCHVRPESGAELAWTAETSRGGARGLNRFVHATHVPITAERGCATCHVLGEEGVEFEPLARATCLECHGASGASSDCTTCHEYHARTERPGGHAPLSAWFPKRDAR